MSPYLSLIDLTLPTAFLATAGRTESGAIHRLDKTRAGIKKKIATLQLNFRQEAPSLAGVVGVQQDQLAGRAGMGLVNAYRLIEETC